MPIIAAVYLFCYFSKNHICSRLILSFSTKIFLNIQWGNINNESGASTLIFPIAFKNIPFIVNCAEHSAMGWNTEVAIGGADASRATNTQVVIYSKWVTSVGIMQRGQNVEWFALGI